METFKHAIKAYRGETFTIDKVIRNQDGTPFVISNELQNPHFLISVSNTKYSQENRFVRNYWLSLEDFPKFTMTRPLDTKYIENWSRDLVPTIADGDVELDDAAYLFIGMSACHIDGGSYDLVNDMVNETTANISGNFKWNYPYGMFFATILTQQNNNVENINIPVKLFSNGRVYSSVNVLSTTGGYEYYYDDVLICTISSDVSFVWTDESFKYFTIADDCKSSLVVNMDGEMYDIDDRFAVFKDGEDYIYWNRNTQSWEDYKCRIVKTFLSNDTKEWQSQNYQYSIQLVTGVKNREYLENLADLYSISYSSIVPADNDWKAPFYTSDAELYELIKAAGHVFSDDYDVNAPLANVTSQSILAPTEININNYMQGGVLWQT